MSNTLGTLVGSAVLQRALELVFTVRPILNRITLSLSGEGGSPYAKLNQTVYARTLAVPTVNNFGTGASGVVTTDVAVTLSNHKEVHHAFTAAEYNATDRALVDEAAMPMAVALANHMVDAIAALWTTTNFTTETVEQVANCDYETCTGLRGTLMARGVPANLRKFLAVNASVYTEFLNDTTIHDRSKNPGSGSIIASGMIENVADFDIFEYPSLPTGDNLIGFAGTPDSTVLAVRVPTDPQELMPGVSFPGRLGYVTEPKTGLTVMATQWIDAATLVANTRLNWMYGVAKGNANNGQRLVSASTAT